MSTEFDPYHRWLGIPPKDQPADHYRLLGIDRFEADPEVIRDAAERQMAHVRRYALGQHQAISQRILNELGAARACLLDAEKKARYDAELRAMAADSSAAEAPAAKNLADWDPSLVAVLTAGGPAESASPWASGGKPARSEAASKTSRLPIPPTILLVVGIVAGALLLIGAFSRVFLGGKKGGEDKGHVATAEAPASSANPATIEPKPATPKIMRRPEKAPEATRESPKVAREPEEPKPSLAKTQSQPPLAMEAAKQAFTDREAKHAKAGDDQRTRDAKPNAAQLSAEDHERRAAEWVLSVGGMVEVLAGNAKLSLKKGNELPSGKFVVRAISSLEGNKAVTDQALSRLRQLCAVGSLRLGATAVTDHGLEHLNSLSTLRELQVQFTAITGDGLRHVSRLPNLQFMDVSGLKLGRQGFAQLAEIRSLENLVLNGTDVTDADLRVLTALRGLRHIHLQATKGVTKTGISQFKAAMPNCTVLGQP